VKKKQRWLRARVGDLAIAKFDNTEHLCVVSSIWDRERYRFTYWFPKGNRFYLLEDVLPRHRLRRVKPAFRWNGTLTSLTKDNVEPVMG